MNKFIFYLLTCLFLLPLKTMAQDFRGKIISATEIPIAFANVVLLSAQDSLFIDGTVTNTDGCFILQTEHASKANFILRISFIGYETKYLHSGGNYDLGTIILDESPLELGEFMVTANKPVFKSLNGSIFTDVSNSILSKEHSITDLLTKIPGLTNNKGIIEVFGSGTPVYYINTKKVQDVEEVHNLSVENIKSIELITNPGSRYDAETNAVIKIVTLRKEEGISVQVRGGAVQSKYFSHNESMTLSYTKGGFSTSAYYYFNEYKGHSTQYVTKEAQVDTLWKYVTDRDRTPKEKRHYYRLNFDYEISPAHIVGLQLNGSYKDQKAKVDEWNDIYANNQPFLNFRGTSDLGTAVNNLQVNLFYNQTINEKLVSNLNVDYVRYTDPRDQIVEEIYTDEKITTCMDSDSKVNIYAGEYVIDYQMNEHNLWVGGVNYSYIDSYGDLLTESVYVGQQKFTNEENKFAGFIDYTFTFENLSLNAGLRYEQVKSTYRDLYKNTNNIDRKYRRLFPSFRIAYRKNAFNHALTFTSRTERPPLSFLNGQTYYQNQFMYQIGNPQMVPQTSYILEWMTGYRGINFRTSYTRTNDYISSIFKEYEADHSKIVSTWDNFRKADFIKANINYQHTFLNVGIPLLR